MASRTRCEEVAEELLELLSGIFIVKISWKEWQQVVLVFDG